MTTWHRKEFSRTPGSDVSNGATTPGGTAAPLPFETIMGLGSVRGDFHVPKTQMPDRM